MYKTIRRQVSRTKNGTYRRNDWFLDFEKLPWMEWMDMHPMRKGQLMSIRLLYPILLQEINTAKPSKLLHFMIGKGVLNWQDVVVIQHNRQTDLEMNPIFLRILLTRGEDGFYAFMEGLRSRHGGWQGYLADMIEMRFNPAILRDLLDIFKIICHDLTKISPVGWSALPRALGLPFHKLERAKRQNRLLVNQALHSLLLWGGHRDDKEGILKELLDGLKEINRIEIAESIIRLLYQIERMYGGQEILTDYNKEKTKPVEDGEGRHENTSEEDILDYTPVQVNDGLTLPAEEDLEVAAVFAESRRKPSFPKGKSRRNMSSVDSGLASQPSPPPRPETTGFKRKQRSHSRLSVSPRPRRSISQRSNYNSRLRSLTPICATDPDSIVHTGKLYTYGLSPRRKSSAWDGRSPTILQRDYSAHPNHDNLFMDYLVYQ